METESIRQALKELATNAEKIGYLEKLARKGGSHFVLYSLASHCLEEGDHERAEGILREDLKEDRDLFEQYESYSLLMGIAVDRKRELTDKEIAACVSRFDKMREEAYLELQDIDHILKDREDGAPEAEEGGDALEGAASAAGAQPAPGGGNGGAGESAREAGEKGMLAERRKALKALYKDKYQFERMLGDYYYGRGDVERAFLFYGRFYGDMDKPAESFVNESMRKYIALLLKKEKVEEALVFMGYLVNLRPYMLEDLVSFSDLYYMIGDRLSALLLQMFISTLSEGYSREYYEKSRNMMSLLVTELRDNPENKRLLDLVDVFFTGENIKEIPAIIDQLEREGSKNFFFYYLRGFAAFMSGDYGRALRSFTSFNEYYPYLAESYYYALVSMYNLDLKKHSRGIVNFAEKAIELKPKSSVGKMTKKYLGILLGLDDEESEMLLISPEIASILNEFLYRGAPQESLAPLVDSLTVDRNPYQVALIQLLSKVNARKAEFTAYLKRRLDELNEMGRRNVTRVLAALDEPSESEFGN